MKPVTHRKVHRSSHIDEESSQSDAVHNVKLRLSTSSSSSRPDQYIESQSFDIKTGDAGRSKTSLRMDLDEKDATDRRVSEAFGSPVQLEVSTISDNCGSHPETSGDRSGDSFIPEDEHESQSNRQRNPSTVYSEGTIEEQSNKVVRTSARIKKHTVRFAEMKASEKPMKHQRSELRTSDDGILDSNEEELVDVVTNVGDKRKKDRERHSGRTLRVRRKSYEVENDGRRAELFADSDAFSDFTTVKEEELTNISAESHYRIQNHGISTSANVQSQRMMKGIPATAPLLTTNRSSQKIVRRYRGSEHYDSDASFSERSLEKVRDEPPEDLVRERVVESRERRSELENCNKDHCGDSSKSPSNLNFSSRIYLRPLGPLSEHANDMKDRSGVIVVENGEEMLYETVDATDEELLKEFGAENILYMDEDVEIIDQGNVNEHLANARSSAEVGQTSKSNSVALESGYAHNLHDTQDDEELPPNLSPEGEADVQEDYVQLDRDAMQETEYVEGVGEVIRFQSPGGTEQYFQVPEQAGEGDVFYLDGNNAMLDEPPQHDLRVVEFSFLDAKSLCCGLCGVIVPFDQLISDHLPNFHSEFFASCQNAEVDDVPYFTWLREKLINERTQMENNLRAGASHGYQTNAPKSTRSLRKISQIRVNPQEMSLEQLDVALKKKMIEKVGRRVPVSLVDKQHARCGICHAVVSLNRKFEVIHLVRHFNAWHPSAHRCAGTWKSKVQTGFGLGKPLSVQDFAIIDTSANAGDNLQCIWCGMFMSMSALAMHFSEVHPDDVEVPKCNLCLKELVINARLTEKYQIDFAITLPDEHHIHCGKFDTTHASEFHLEKVIDKRLRLGHLDDNYGIDFDDDDDPVMGTAIRNYGNSGMQLGRRSKPKRKFIMPALRQAAPPSDSKFVEPVSHSHWKCKICGHDILAAVISAGAIKHYRTAHPGKLDDMQYELVKARLERISDGCMQFVHPQLIECLVCNMSYILHRPYNMCRAIRHLKSKHPDAMPEYIGTEEVTKMKRSKLKGANDYVRKGADETAALTEEGFITDPRTIATLKAQYNVEFDKVKALEGPDGRPVYVLMSAGEEIDPEIASQLAESLATTGSDFDKQNDSSVPESATAAEEKNMKEDGELSTKELLTQAIEAEDKEPSEASENVNMRRPRRSSRLN